MRSLARASIIQSPWHSTQLGPLLKAVGPCAPYTNVHVSKGNSEVELEDKAHTEEHVGEVCARHSDVRVSAVRPTLAKVHTVNVEKTHILHATSHRVEASRKSDDIKLPLLSIRRDDTLLGNLLHGVILDIDDVILGPVDSLVEVLLQTRSLGSPRVRCFGRRHQITLAGVCDSLPGLLIPELVSFVVRRTVEQVVLISGQPKLEATLRIPRSVMVARHIRTGTG